MNPDVWIICHGHCLAVALNFFYACICRSMTPVYPLMETTAAAVWSWLTLSARRPSSSTETKRLPSRNRKRETLLDWTVKNNCILLFYSPCCCCLFYICGKYSETLTLYCILQTQRATRKKSDVNRLFTMRMHLHIFLMYIFYKRLNCDKGFYVFIKYRVYVVLFHYSGLMVSALWMLPHEICFRETNVL